MTPVRAIVVDDERLARERLIRLLGALPGVTVAGAYGDAEAARAAIADADVVILDVEMPGLTGLDLAKLLPEPRPFVIFCTAHAAYAPSAFDVGAVDYVLKPVDAGRLALAMDRARNALAARSTPLPLARLAVETRAGVELIDPAEIAFADFDGALVTLHVGGRRVLTDLPLSTLEQRLPAGAFTRVSRRALVNLAHVTRLEPTPTGGYLAHTRDGHAVEVSRKAARDLRRALGLSSGRGEGGSEG